MPPRARAAILAAFVATIDAPVVFEKSSPLEMRHHATHRFLKHFGDFAPCDMSQHFEEQLASELSVDAIEKHDMQVRIESQVARRALHDDHGAALSFLVNPLPSSYYSPGRP